MRTIARRSVAPHTASSGGTGVPVNSALPTISGSATVGSLLSASTGSWGNTPTGFTYQWQDQGTGNNIGSGSTYTVGTGDQGFAIVVIVTASNASGNSAPATSAPTATVPTGGGGGVANLIVPAGFNAITNYTNLAHSWNFTTGSLPSGWTINNLNDYSGANLYGAWSSYYTNSSSTIRFTSSGIGLGIAPYPTQGAYQAGWIDTFGTYSPSVGCRIRVYVETPQFGTTGAASGIWPAIWVRGGAYPGNTNPYHTVNGVSCYPEIDIWEGQLQDETQFFGTLWQWAASTNTGVSGFPLNGGPAYPAKVANTSNGFHWFELVWQQGQVTWGYDGIAVEQASSSIVGTYFNSSPTTKLVVSSGVTPPNKWENAYNSANNIYLTQNAGSNCWLTVNQVQVYT